MGAIIAPGRRVAYPPIGRLRTSPLSGGGKKGMFIALNLTAMVDMFTILVIFLIQMFKASGEVELNDKIKVPKSVNGAPLEEPGTIVMLFPDGLMLLDGSPIPAEEMGTDLDATIPGVVTRLTDARKLKEKYAGRDESQPYDGILLVQADVKADFKQVRRIIGSANAAGWAKFRFVTTPALDATSAMEGTNGPPPKAKEAPAGE